MAIATATTYQGTFHGRAEELSRVRREIADYLADCPASDELVLIADELAANCILPTRSRGESFLVRCKLSPGSVRIEVEDMGGPWRKRREDDRPHGLDIVEALTGPDGWGTERTSDDTHVVWARLSWEAGVTRKIPAEQSAIAGANIRALRQRNGWTQARLAELTGWPSTSTVCAAEGRRNDRQRGFTTGELTRLAAIFGISPWQLTTRCVICDGHPPAGFACLACGAAPSTGQPTTSAPTRQARHDHAAVSG